ncbi:hypothetical protein [Vibrio nigripulchritudo]|uniref:hypothetical protein n=1 Tax=Vibrio nigripulchritudo TaxID=28173 RepID=UPI001F32832D|nr:hypothetical protein [Vibrio nigripulchritudo]
MAFALWCATCWSIFLQIQVEMMGLVEALVISFVTGLVSTSGTISALKTDINWIKKVQQDQEQRIRKLEDSHS